MSKGKKYSAAEKHFLEKEIAYRKEQKRLYENIDTAQATTNQLKVEIAELNEKLAIALAERNEALKLASMSPEEMQNHIKQIKAAADSYRLLSAAKGLY